MFINAIALFFAAFRSDLAFDRRDAAGFRALRDDGGANACRRDQEHAADRHQRRGLIKEEPADDRGKGNGRESRHDESSMLP